ncbi:hypothetical protein VNO77_22545 [Canavalia gladiata]|uniref:Uncharacterized protein n=1 Tax=Canavalia gladiata TaxID=3824 RepID=A0AAN9L394_CANGL
MLATGLGAQSYDQFAPTIYKCHVEGMMCCMDSFARGNPVIRCTAVWGGIRVLIVPPMSTLIVWGQYVISGTHGDQLAMWGKLKEAKGPKCGAPGSKAGQRGRGPRA